LNNEEFKFSIESSFLLLIKKELIMKEITKKFSRRTIALFWLVLVAIVIGFLLIYEQIAALYILATVSLVALLLIVAFADLEKVGRENAEGFAPGE
jgi:hypothetical protein